MKYLTIAMVLSLLPVLTACSRGESSASYKVSAPQLEIDQTHAAFTAVLKGHLKDNKVDYAKL